MLLFSKQVLPLCLFGIMVFFDTLVGFILSSSPRPKKNNFFRKLPCPSFSTKSLRKGLADKCGEEATPEGFLYLYLLLLLFYWNVYPPLLNSRDVCVVLFFFALYSFGELFYCLYFAWKDRGDLIILQVMFWKYKPATSNFGKMETERAENHSSAVQRCPHCPVLRV